MAQACLFSLGLKCVHLGQCFGAGIFILWPLLKHARNPTFSHMTYGRIAQINTVNYSVKYTKYGIVMCIITNKHLLYSNEAEFYFGVCRISPMTVGLKPELTLQHPYVILTNTRQDISVLKIHYYSKGDK